MNDKLYTTIKLALMKYSAEFGKPHNFTDLYNFSRQFNHGLPFKEFVRVCQNMGVYSVVKRLDTGKLKRVLIYDMTIDKYITGDIAVLKQCEACHGTGVTQANMSVITDR